MKKPLGLRDHETLGSKFSLITNTVRFLGAVTEDLVTTFLSSLKARSEKQERGLTIGFDGYPFVEPLTGIGHYAYHVLKGIAGKERVKVNLYTHTLIPEDTAPGLFISLVDLENVRYRFHPIPSRILFGTKFWFGLGAVVLTPILLALDRNDVFFAPNYLSPPLFRVIGKKVITVHDCTFAFYPDLLRQETLKHLLRYLPKEVRRASKIIADSRQTKKDIQEIYSLPPEKIQVIFPGNPIQDTSLVLPLKKPYLLFVGTLEPRKNIVSVLDAYEIVRKKGILLNLYLVGKVGWKSDQILARLTSHPFSGAISHASYVSSEDLAAYYKEAFCLLFPSLYEGFGFPVLEAMSLGCPVITTRLSSLPEVGEDACLYVEPDANSIAGGIIDLYENEQLRDSLVLRGKRQAQKFSWEKCAQQTLEVLAKACRS